MSNSNAQARINCILLMDEDMDNSSIHHQLVKNLYIADKIESAANAEEAIRFMINFSIKNQNHCPELILLNINNAEEGIQFIENLNQIKFVNRSKVKVIFMITFKHENDLNQLKKLKAAYIQKPITKEKIMSLL
jgi:response regulator of citrate/malate metabolism